MVKSIQQGYGMSATPTNCQENFSLAGYLVLQTELFTCPICSTVSENTGMYFGREKTTGLQITSKQPGGCGTWLWHQVKTNLDTVEIWRQACPLAHRAPLPARSSGLAWRMPRRPGPSANIGWAHLDERNTAWQIPMPLEILLAESSKGLGNYSEVCIHAFVC